MKLTNYIIFHDKESLKIFIVNNPHFDTNVFKFICVGNPASYDGCEIIRASDYENNIEHYPSLLAFTAWYLIAKNNICKTEFVGMFEYDVVFKNYNGIGISSLNPIFGFNQRKLPDSMYLNCLPEFKKLLAPAELKIANDQPFWNTTSNFIMPMEFLTQFVDWYMQFVPRILELDKHSHFHERAVNVFAANEGYENITIDLIEHKQLCSHGVQL